MGRRLVADPRTARIAAAAALVLGALGAVSPTAILLSRTAVGQAVVLHTGSGREAALTRQQPRGATVEYLVSTRFGRKRIMRGTLTAGAKASINVPLPRVACATPVVVRTLEASPRRTRSVAITVLPPAGTKPQCGE